MNGISCRCELHAYSVAIHKRFTKGFLKSLRVHDKEDLAEGDIGVPPFRVIGA